jgi:glycosyltransferase involved in cell wall biosynthesis
VKRLTTLSYIANNRIPSEKAHSIYVLKMCDAFASLGIDVELVAPYRFQNRRKYNLSEISRTYAIKNKISILHIPSPDFLPLEKWLGCISKFLYPVQSIIFAVFVVCRALLKRRRSYYVTCDMWVAFLLSLCPSVNAAYDMQIIPYSRVRKLMLKLIIRRGALIITLTSAMKEMLAADFGVQPGQMINLHDAFDEELFNTRLDKAEARRLCGFPADSFIIGYVGKFTTMGEEKGVANLIEALRLLIDEKYMLLLVGDDESLLPPHDDVNVVVVPHVSQSKLLPFLRSCDVAVMPFPRTPHYEICMSPMKLFEYMASGAPVITTDLPSVREVVGADDVFFISGNSQSEIADAINYLRANPLHAKALAESALKKAGQYTWRKRAESFVSFLTGTLQD